MSGRPSRSSSSSPTRSSCPDASGHKPSLNSMPSSGRSARTAMPLPRARNADGTIGLPVAGAATHASRAGAPFADAGVTPGFSVASPSVPESAPWAVDDSLEPIAQPVGGRLRAPYVGVGLAALAVVVVAVLMWRSATGPVGPAVQSAPSGARALSTAPESPVPSAPAASVPAPPRWTAACAQRRAHRSPPGVDSRHGRRSSRPRPADRRRRTDVVRRRPGDCHPRRGRRGVPSGGRWKRSGVLGRDGQIFEKSFSAKTR